MLSTAEDDEGEFPSLCHSSERNVVKVLGLINSNKIPNSFHCCLNVLQRCRPKHTDE